MRKEKYGKGAWSSCFPICRVLTCQLCQQNSKGMQIIVDGTLRMQNTVW